MNIPIDYIKITDKAEGYTYHPEGTKYFKVPCGKTYPTQFWTEEKIKTEHMDKCRVCAIVTGKSKRKTGFTEEEVAKLWALGYEAESSTGNYDSALYRTGDRRKRLRIRHYNTWNAIKTFQGKIIVNSQDYAAGFAYLTRPSDWDHIMPLEVLQYELGGDLESIEILDTEDGQTLFKMLRKHYLTPITVEYPEGWAFSFYLLGRDENQDFLVELFDRPTTLQKALISLKPQIVRDAELNGRQVKRQGDLFFIEQPLYTPDGEIHKASYKERPIWIYGGEEGEKERYLDVPQIILTEFKDYSLEDGQTRIRRSFGPSSVETNHYATRLNYKAHITAVKGTIRHEEHKMLNLGMETWWRVEMNRKIASIPLRGGAVD